MKLFPAFPTLVLLLLAWVVGSPRARAEALPYRGQWSNGRGETLVISAATLRFNRDRAVAYRDLTRATDGHRFELQITARGEVNGFSGKFLSVTCGRDEMRLVGFASHADLFRDENPLEETIWFKEAGDGDDNDDE